METKTFENDAYAVEASQSPGCKLNAKITIKPKSAQKAYKKAVKTINKQISIPGFRKGRAPDATVINRYASHIEQEWKDILVNDAYRAALELTDIYPMSKESVEKPKIDSCSQEEGAVISLTYEHYPTVPTVDFSTLALPTIEKQEPAEERVEEIIQEVLSAHAEFEPIEGRGIEVGDYADLTIDNLDEDPPKPLVSDRRFEVREKKMAPWLLKLLMGMKPEEETEGVSEADETMSEEAKKNFKPTKVRITVNGLKKILLPELNDELAKKVGAESKEDLYTKIRANLEEEAAAEQKNKQLEALEEKLLDSYPFELPQSVVEGERRQRIEQRIRMLQTQQLPDEEIKGQEQAIEEEVSKEVDAILRLYFLEKQIAKQGSLSLSNEELNNELVRQVTQNPSLYGKDMSQEASREMVNRLASSLMQRKAKEYALEQVLGQVNA